MQGMSQHEGKQIMSQERKVIEHLSQALNQKKPPSLKGFYKNVNLASKGFETIWKSWWEDYVPRQLEVDIVLAFSDYGKILEDDGFIMAVELEQLDSPKKNFYEGLHQVLAFSIFGFDALVLWHTFSEGIDETRIKAQAKALEEVIDGLKLPITYFSTKLLNDVKLRCFSPSDIPTQMDVDYVVGWMYEWGKNHRNPLLQSEIVRRRRKTIKAMLQIPI